jgi:predicted Zn-dependent protease
MKPSDELLGELLLEHGRARDAIAHFEAALDRNPNRSASILGLARALQATGDHNNSRERYRAFLENWRSADPERPELEEARRAVEKDSAGAMAPVVFIATVTAAVAAVIVVRRRRSVAAGAPARTGAGARKARRPRA